MFQLHTMQPPERPHSAPLQWDYGQFQSSQPSQSQSSQFLPSSQPPPSQAQFIPPSQQHTPRSTSTSIISQAFVDAADPNIDSITPADPAFKTSYNLGDSLHSPGEEAADPTADAPEERHSSSSEVEC